MTADNSPRGPTGGCGMSAIYEGVFGRRSFWHRRASSTSSIPRVAPMVSGNKTSGDVVSRRRTISDEAAGVAPSKLAPKSASKLPLGTRSNLLKGSLRRPLDTSKTLVAMPSMSTAIAGELDAMISERERGKGGSLMRVSSGNVMVYGNLGNLRNGNSSIKGSANRNVLDYLPKTAKELQTESNLKKDNSNVFSGTKQNGGNAVVTTERGQSAEPELCRALSRRLEPEELKELGNEEYKSGRFAEALAYYDRAIVLNPRKASYYSNKAAALMGLGQLLEAVAECREAIRIEPSYYRAHCRMATIYFRLGETEKAIHHFKLSKNEASSKDISKAQALQAYLAKSNEARKSKDYMTLLKESQSAASIGADSSPQVFALQAEALLKLDRHEEADSILNAVPKFDTDESTKALGAMANAYFHMIRAQVDMAVGRFDIAVTNAHKAAQLDPSSREISGIFRRTKAAAAARARGNDLFKASKFAEACIAYSEGLNHDSRNAVLLCNRAACRAKLGQYEQAIEDCNTALLVCPSYSKARLRRADCNAKLEKWEESIKDYVVLAQELPGDEEVSKAFSEAQTQLKKQQSVHANGTD